MSTTASSSNKSFLARVLARRSTDSTSKYEKDQPNGPLGLTTLYEPDGKVAADLIFVHGLNGGSRSTWSKAGNGAFWPYDWLSRDDAFHDVRTHTFGYSSGLTHESILDIHDFASNLLAHINHCPIIMSNADVSSLRIVI
ncbi:putative NACHT and WD domain-containing protein [Rosellinia necatrix]|uniref:Putative NACHT and WD domain-containing protein n=1 Tax=Rosellinia necatrix TaxID=77044 RepID=A0A1S8A6Y3_ROSNE|nr:putative NACHT and WD domain-containing protein [Rosellinia necatrix]